jgi:VWFA-related protein
LPALGDASTYLSGAASDFSARTGLLALRSLAKGLASIPGRKILILFSAGFVLDADNRPELTAAIDACNKANVAIYPIDARGLVADAPGKQSAVQYPDHSYFKLASYMGPPFAFAQRGGVGGGGKPAPGGGTGGRAGGSPGGVVGGARGNLGGTTGRAAGSGAAGGTYGTASPTVDQRVIIPPFPPSASTNQQVLYMLADGTGGFVILNTNDLVGGLEKIGKEQDEYYLLGYSAPESKEGSCHTLRVKVNRGGTVVRARSGYCNAKPLDALAGNPTAKDLEGRAASSLPGTVAASMQAPFFYTSRNTARVNVAIDIASAGLKFEKVKGKFHSEVNVLGMIYTPNGSIAARFSDAVKIDLDDKKEVEAFHQQPLHYENQFEAAAGQYNLKVVFSAGREGFGKVETPLVIEPYDGKHFAMSAVVLSNRTVQASGIDAGLDAALLEDRKPLLAQGWRIVPSGANRLKKTGTAVVYVEVYEPVLPGPNAPSVAVQIRVVDRKTGQEKFDSGPIGVNDYGRPGSPVIPIGLTLAPALEKLAAGPYRAEVKAVDSLGNSSAVRLADFEVE